MTSKFQNKNSYHFHYKCTGRYTYFCVSTPDYPLRICFKFLDSIELNFVRKKLKEEEEIINLLKNQMAFHNDQSNDQISLIKNQVDEVKDHINENLDKVITRGETLERLIEDTEELSKHTISLKKKGKSLKYQSALKCIIIIACLLALLILGIYLY
jgi:thermostable 8-oxoguanine DNA glycosylase